MRACLEEDMGARLSIHHPLSYWLVEAAADSMNRYRPAWGGKTPRQRVRGFETPRKIADFGECIFYLPPKVSGKTAKKADLKFKEGVWLGLDARTNEVIVFGPDGIARARTFRRKVIEDAFRKEEILKVNITPWDETITESEQAPIQPEPVEQPEAPLAPAPKRMCIRKSDVQQAGYTPGCPGCRAIQFDLRQQAHSTSPTQRKAEIEWTEQQIEQPRRWIGSRRLRRDCKQE